MFLLLQEREKAQPLRSGAGSLEKEDKQLGNYFVRSKVNDGNNLQRHTNSSPLLHRCYPFKNRNKNNLGIHFHVCSDYLSSNIKEVKIKVNCMYDQFAWPE